MKKVALCSPHSETWLCFAQVHYGWRTANLPTNCICGKPFTIEHSLSCSFGGFPTIRHDKLCDVLLTFYLKFVQTFRLNHSSNHFLEKLCPIVLPMPIIMPDWIYLPKGFRILLMSLHLLM